MDGAGAPKGKNRMHGGPAKRTPSIKEERSEGATRSTSTFSERGEMQTIETYDDIYKLAPGEGISAGRLEGIYTRVPGGWTYTDGSGVCFIPYSDEFKGS